jgi:hypothetical protein
VAVFWLELLDWAAQGNEQIPHSIKRALQENKTIETQDYLADSPTQLVHFLGQADPIVQLAGD